MIDKIKKSSPLPIEAEEAEEKQIDFPTAMQAIIDDKKITRKEWANKEIYGVKNDGFLMLHKEDNKFYSWIISDGDIYAKDWIII